MKVHIIMKTIKKSVYIMMIIISLLSSENASAATKKALNVTMKVNEKKPQRRLLTYRTRTGA